MAVTQSSDLEIGSKAPSFTLPGTDGKDHSLNDNRFEKAILIIFMCNHCPYVKAMLPRFIELQKDFKVLGAQLIGINSNDAVKYPDDSFDAMKKLAEEQGLNFPYLYDEAQEVAKAYGAVCTPDIFLFDSEKNLAYHGRLDDNWEHPDQADEHSLRFAMDELLSGQEITREQHPSMGCSIKWK